MADNIKWIHKLDDDLKQKYDKRYVAIKDRKYQDKKCNLTEMIKRLNIRNPEETIATEYTHN
ncbi:MAG TPA: hypothetical protein VFG45_14005 [Candidatus Nitrosocosmicus sp.]|nr:hypothetical protein [Candidatus Nitrosocosmicus sp.]